MNFDRRYCQNRVQKRKKKLENLLPKVKVTSAEEERQFKLSRFVQDVNKFMEEEGNTLEKEKVSNKFCGLQKKTSKVMKSSNLLPRRGLFQNGIQTKFYTRGVYGKEMTARLDEDLQQIISLANKESKENSHRYRRQVNEPRNAEASTSVVHPSPQLLYPRNSNIDLCGVSRESPDDSPRHPTPPSARSARTEYGEVLTESGTSVLQNLDRQLYPEFIRIVTLSSVESKLAQFKDKSYVSALKRTLLKMYRQGKKENENSEDLSCPSDIQKSSVATSPLRSPSSLPQSPPDCTYSRTQHTSGTGQGFTRITFVQEPLKSSIQFLEETIGPGSSCKSVKMSPEPQWSREHSIPSTSWQQTQHRSKLECRELPPRDTSVHPPYNIMMPFDGGGDRPLTNKFNWFLPHYEEDSPEFQYFPRRMF